MYNRAATIGRGIESILTQNFKDYEVIVVDDGSKDNSVAVVEGYLPNDSLKLIKSPENRGVCAARGLGVKNAQGHWFLFIGSDDAFKPNALTTIYEETCNAPEEVGEVQFCYYCEAIDEITPIPLMPEGIIGFTDYLKWLEKASMSYDHNYMYCQRRKLYELISWPEDRQYETLYHLTVAFKTKTMMSRKVVATVYNDAQNRLTKQDTIKLSAKGKTIFHDEANSKVEILKEYGEQVKKYCPNFYERLHSYIGKSYMLCGRKAEGCRYLLRYLRMRPLSITGWGMLTLGLFGPNAINWMKQKCGKKIRAIGRNIGVE